MKKGISRRAFSFGSAAALLSAKGRVSLDALMRFRRTHERLFIANLDHCAWVEKESWQVS